MTDNVQTSLDTDNIEWLSFYPRGVPPKESKAADGLFYRIAMNNPPQKGCFLSMYESNPKRMKKYKGFQIKCCYGVSVYTEESALLNAFDKFPEGSGVFYISKGYVSAEDGNMMKTCSDPAHHTIWLRKENKIYEKFSCDRGISK